MGQDEGDGGEGSPGAAGPAEECAGGDDGRGGGDQEDLREQEQEGLAVEISSEASGVIGGSPGRCRRSSGGRGRGWSVGLASSAGVGLSVF